MNSSTKLIIGIILILGNATRAQLGFILDFSSSGLIYNAVSAGLYVFGFWLIGEAYRVKGKNPASREIKPAVKAPPVNALKKKFKL